jgi:hypothetical protein
MAPSDTPTGSPPPAASPAPTPPPDYTCEPADVLAAEDSFIAARRGAHGLEPSADRIGLAFSGGGIRSASVAIGAMQALVRDQKLKIFDYLSTVSGGGYAGTALTWMLSTHAGAGVGRENFPLSGPRRGAIGAGGAAPEHERLDHIRQRANYLTPDRSLTLLSALGVVLRSALVSLAVYVPLSIAAMIMAVLLAHAVIEPTPLGGAEVYDLVDRLRHGGAPAAFIATTLEPSLVAPASPLMRLATIVVLLALAGFAALSLGFSLLTRRRRAASSNWRRRSQRLLGRLLTVLVAAAALAGVPLVASWIDARLSLGAGSAAAGLVLGWAATLVRVVAARPHLRTALALAAIVLLGYGLLVISYIAATALVGSDVQGHWPPEYLRGLAAAIILAAFGFAVGTLCNANYTSPHRMYRDRLMEAFMPRPRRHFHPAWGETDPDSAELARMCGANWLKATTPQNGDGYPGPYHLINANLILTNADAANLRGRGGDNFILSPAYCGSTTTGWRRTATYGLHKRRRSTMHLATAMAISGAAANPGAAGAGQGITRSVPVSWLMTLLNFRLGYEELHPRDANRRFGCIPAPARPNHIVPGLQRLVGSGHHEDAAYVELSDGGHFDNLGLYELVRRRCRIIMCIDAEADGALSFASLNSVLQRVRVDFGVNIDMHHDLDLEALRFSKSPRSGLVHKFATRGFALGVIRYPPSDGSVRPGAGGPLGLLVYVKSTLTAGLPADVIGHARQDPSFPHRSTADQWFDETQFESYRELGYRLTGEALGWGDRAADGVGKLLERIASGDLAVLADRRQLDAWISSLAGGAR